MKLKYGTTRVVVLFGKYAIKFPRINKWKSFIKGILANLDELMWYKNSPKEWKIKMCPSLFTLGGLFLISRRAEPVDLNDYQKLDVSYFEPLPLDCKIDNFGKFENRIVLIDYADTKYFCSDCELIFKLKHK